METFSWSSPSSLSFTFAFTFMCLLSMIYKSEAQHKTDPVEVKALNTIFAKWGVSADPSWNTSGEPCSNKSIDSEVKINEFRYNPFIKCTCSHDNGTLCRITKIWIVALNARGEIPEELQNLTYLDDLNLSKNYLTGPLPAFIGNLTKLEYLSFGTNALTGKIPKELGNLRNLITLSLGSNNFSGSLPLELGNLYKLEKLYIDSAGLSGKIPSSFANLKSLKIFWASGNDFIGKLPDFIGSWTNMEDLIRHRHFDNHTQR